MLKTEEVFTAELYFESDITFQLYKNALTNEYRTT